MKKTILITAIGLTSLVAMAGEDLQFERSLSLATDRLSGVEFDVGAGSLSIVGTTGNEIKVNATIASDGYKNMDDFVEGFTDKMTFSLKRDSGFALLTAKNQSQMNWGKSKNIAIHLEVEVPKSMDLVIDDGSGSIVVENIDGSIEIDDGSGSITLRQINNNVEIDDNSGSIQLADVSGDVIIDDGSGSVEMKNIGGSIEIEDGSGSIMAKDISGDFTVDDGSGDVVVKELVGQFNLINDGSGSITVNGEKWSKK
jgi:DUF4097 and DUF4098 domain-containing protein YvlB